MPHQVTVNKANTTLPNGFTYQAGAVVILSNEQYAKLAPTVYTGGSPTLTNGGNVP